MAESNRDLTTGTVRSRLLQLGAPMTLGIVAAMAVPLMDSFYLGQIGTQPLAAISYTFPVVLTLMSLAIGLGAGTSSVVARAIGDGGDQRAKCLSTDATILALALVAALSVVGYFTIRPIFGLLGATGETLAMVETYMEIWYLGYTPLAVMMVASNLMRANGDAKTASVLLIGIAVFNAILDPILIFGIGPIPAMEIAGAAWASFISQVLVMLFAIWVVVFRDRLVELGLRSLADTAKSWLKIGRIAVPAAFGNAVNPLGITIVTGFIAGYGDDVVAGFGVATRIESFVAIPMLALSAAIGPIAGQNFGKGEVGRVYDAHRQSYVFIAGWSVFVALVLWFAAPFIARLFSDEEGVTSTIATYLRIVPITLAGYGFSVVAAAGLNSIGRPLSALGMYLIRTMLLYVPLAWFASTMFDAWGVFVAIAVANVAGGVAILLWSLKTLPGNDDDAPAPASANV
ncbi:MAG: MATE family efflux transporter [Pseudomonadota bacterium]